MSTKNLSPLGLAAWPAIGNIYTNDFLFYYIEDIVVLNWRKIKKIPQPLNSKHQNLGKPQAIFLSLEKLWFNFFKVNFFHFFHFQYIIQRYYL